MLASHWVSGCVRIGFILMILGAGFSGIVVIIWGGGMKTMRDRLSAGRQLLDMLVLFVKIVLRDFGIVGRSSDRHCYTGLMIVARFN